MGFVSGYGNRHLAAGAADPHLVRPTLDESTPELEQKYQSYI